jgi:hypothetical protein
MCLAKSKEAKLMNPITKALEWCRLRKCEAEEDLADFENGFQIHLDGVNVSNEWRERARSDIERFTRLITYYAKQDA